MNFLESKDTYQEKMCWEFLQSPRAVHVMKLLYAAHGIADIHHPAAPRWGVMRPTGINSAWRTQENWLHWDQNPWSHPGFLKVQCFACVSPQTASSGGLLCVPGFHKQWDQWGRDHPEGSVIVDGKKMTRNHGPDQVFPVPKHDPAQQQVVRILAPAGSLVLWDGRLPHQNYPNTGRDFSDFRMVLYLGYMRVHQDLDGHLTRRRRDEMRRKLLMMRALGRTQTFWPSGLTALGRRLTGAPELSQVESVDAELCAKPLLVEAIRLAKEAGEEEVNGNYDASVAKLSLAEKKIPGLGCGEVGRRSLWMSAACVLQVSMSPTVRRHRNLLSIRLYR